MDIESEYINAVLHLPAHEAHLAGQAKITSDLFITHKPEHEYIKNYLARVGRPPTKSLFARKFPDFDIELSNETVEDLGNELLDRYRRNIIVDVVNEIDEDELRANLEHHIKELEKTVITLAAHNTQDSDDDYRQSHRKRLQSYKERKANLQSKIFHTGCDKTDVFLDGGIFPGQLVTLAGDPGMGKTWWLVNAAIKNYLVGKSVLIISPEASKEEIQERIDAMMFQVNYTRLRMGKLDPPEETKFKRGMLAQSKRKVPLVITDCSEEANYTPNHVAAKIDIYKPSIVFIDSAYYLKVENPKGSYTDSMNLCKQLKIICKRTDTPIVCVVQMDRESEQNAVQGGAALRRMYGGDAWAQTSDLVFRLTGNRNEDYRRLINLKNRVGPTYNEDILKYSFKPYPEVKSTDSYVSEDEDSDDDEVVSIEV